MAPMICGITKRILIVVCLVMGLHLSAQGQDYFPPPDSAGGWRALKDPAQIRKLTGMDVQRLDQAFGYTERTTQHGGLLVLRHGWLVYERYFGKGNREANPQIASVSKAFSSIACGIMLKEKRDLIPEGLDTKVFTERYLPEAFPLDDPRKAGIKLAGIRASEYPSICPAVVRPSRSFRGSNCSPARA